MNDNIHRAQVTIRAMESIIHVLEDVGHRLPENPKLNALLAESPIEELRRMSNELDELLEPLKRTSPTSAPPASIVDHSISPPIAPGPIESTS